jgi:hypothetical protein
MTSIILKTLFSLLWVAPAGPRARPHGLVIGSLLDTGEAVELSFICVLVDNQDSRPGVLIGLVGVDTDNGTTNLHVNVTDTE